MGAAYAHLVLTHVPLIGTLAGILLLGTALIFRSNGVARAGFAALVLSALVTIPAYLTGEAAEHEVERLPGVAEVRVEHHEEVAIFGLAASLALGIIALGGLWYFRRRDIPRLYLFVLLILSFIPFGALAWTANSGGKIRHTEVFPVSGAETEPEAEER